MREILRFTLVVLEKIKYQRLVLGCSSCMIKSKRKDGKRKGSERHQIILLLIDLCSNS